MQLTAQMIFIQSMRKFPEFTGPENTASRTLGKLSTVHILFTDDPF
jgi:hypothetical protein